MYLPNNIILLHNGYYYCVYSALVFEAKPTLKLTAHSYYKVADEMTVFWIVTVNAWLYLTRLLCETKQELI